MLPREILKWLQALQLSQSVRNPKRDFANGYLTAEIVDRYLPGEISLASIDMGIALDRKLNNWDQLKKIFAKINIAISQDIIDGTLHCKSGAAEVLIQLLYMYFNQKSTTAMEQNTLVQDFSDSSYQDTLPLHARNTLSVSIKNNIKPTELKMDSNLIRQTNKVERLVVDHQARRLNDRVRDPHRFGIHPRDPAGLSTIPPKAPKPTELGTMLTTHNDTLLNILTSPSRVPLAHTGVASRNKDPASGTLFEVTVFPPV